MKKIIFLLISILVVSFFVSCGSNEEPKETEKETTVNAPNETTETEDDKNKNGILKINPDDYYKCVVWDLPEGNFRDVAVDYMRKQANIEWVCENGFSVKEEYAHWSIGLEYKKGVTYHGIPYTNAKSSYDEFMLFYNDGKVNMESGGADDVVGNGCFSSTQNATQQFDPDVAGTTSVLMPSFGTFEAKIVGNYKVPEKAQRTADIIKANTVDEIYNAYAQLKKGDLIFQKDETKGMSHVRMLVEDPIIYKNNVGKFVPSRSSVKTIEQTNAFDKTRTDGVNTTWYVDHIYSFAKLYETNYLPVTYESYEKDRSEMEKPYLLLDDEISASILAKKSFSSTVKSNFPIRYVKVDILDKDNNVVASKLKNNMADTRSIPLRNHFSGVFEGVAGGEYTMVLTAGISRGSAELARVEFTCNK